MFAAAHVFRWGVVQISLGNLLVIAIMVVIFVLAVLVRFPASTDTKDPVAVSVPAKEASGEGVGGNWTVGLRGRLSRVVPPGQALPDRQPVYVESFIYAFGVLSVAALLVVVATGLILAIEGSTWWHLSSLGHFVNSTHLWSVELFFAVMVIHLWGKFFMAGWRGNRGLTWATGALAFFGSLGTAFTGYVSQSNFDSQWISTQAKDGLNAAGIGAYFNVLNTGQMLLWHVALLPLVVGVIVVLHLVLVRRHGVVPPIDTDTVSEVQRARSSVVDADKAGAR